MCQEMSRDTRQSEEAEAKARATGVLGGRHSRALDSKRRLTIPSVWRHALGSDYVYVMPDVQDQKSCLRLIPKDVLEARLEEMKRAPLSDEVLNAQLEAIGENTELLEFDVQGRIRISDRMLEYAELKSGVVMKGAFRCATLWAAEKCAEETAVDMAKLRMAQSVLKF